MMIVLPPLYAEDAKATESAEIELMKVKPHLRMDVNSNGLTRSRNIQSTMNVSLSIPEPFYSTFVRKS